MTLGQKLKSGMLILGATVATAGTALADGNGDVSEIVDLLRSYQS